MSTPPHPISHHRPGLLIAGPCLLALLASAFTPQAQTSNESDDAAGRFEEAVTVQWVLVPVVVRSRQGFVDDLDERRFRLLVDDQPVPISSFHHDDAAPVRLLVLQDLSGSMGTQRRLERSFQIVDCFLRRAIHGDRFALATFANQGLQVEVPLTDDVHAIREAAGLWQAYGMTALHDAIAWLPRISGGDASVRPAAVLITDGVDNTSEMSAEEARAIVQRADIPVYTLGMESGDPYALSGEGERLYRYANALHLLSLQTGGRYFSLRPGDDPLAACREILQELRHQYVLGFQTDASTARVRAIEVQVASGRRDWQVSHRRVYSGGAPAAATP